MRGVLALMAVVFVLASPARSQEVAACSARAMPSPYEISEVADDGLVAAFLKPVGAAKSPALIILGGSEGGKDSVRALAKPFAEQGYAALALSWHGAPGLPASYVDVPLEYFDTAIAWLSRNPSVDPKRIGIYGVSKGAEAALLVASRSPQVHAVAAGMPSSVVFQGGTDARLGSEPHSSWTVNGKPIPFVPYDVSKPFDFRDYMGSIFRLYDGGLKDAAAHPDAVIPVERINGPVMLISGKADAMWPAARMADDIVSRLDRKKFQFSVTNLSYPDAGHAVGLPAALGASARGADEAVGGTASGNAFARAAMWPKLICFFDSALRREKGTP